MPTIIAHFDTEAEAERVLSVLAHKTPLQDSAVLTPGIEGTLTLDSLDLSSDERAACEAQLKRGGFIMLVQAEDSEKVLRALDEVAPQIIVAALQGGSSSSRAAEPDAREEVIEEERIPVVEEELRVGTREVRRGTARVHAFPTEAPVRQEVELFEEEATVSRRPAGRRLTDEEVQAGGLLRERVIEIAEMREEPVVSREAFVREELVVTKNVRSRTEQVEGTVRRTEVEMERLDAEEGGPR
ncbi:MAG TPA: YsnF/AvaK domain-containing protein [Allosphingosinicella sp.]|uniref:YsnF/AvaK domain-containing protein n=1 Tax=Allosphingosinicella sp. TaxID=2823234 RepID=UPI002ED799A9